MHTLNLRSLLWFATGVALTITSVATFGAWSVNAGGPPGPAESTFVPVTPCRLFNTLPGKGIPGSNTTPIAEKETRTQPVTGAVGNCNIPAGVSGVAMNVTTLNGTGNSFLAVFPANELTRPVVSNLNWGPGQGATPNKVDVKLSPDGKVKIYNNIGTVDVIGDVIGYYTSSTVSQLSSDVAALQTAVAQLTAVNGVQDANIKSLLEDTNVIPSGVTVTGSYILDDQVTSDTADYQVNLFLPANPPTLLTTDDVIVDDVPCEGTFAAPTAPSGTVCVYLAGPPAGISGVHGFVPQSSDPKKFVVYYFAGGAPGDDMLTHFTWAYTAP